MKNCLICKEEIEILEDKKNKILYSKCKACDFIFMNSEYLISDEAELKIYNYHNNSYDDEVYIDYFKRFIDGAITPFIKGKRGLDFGSGPSPVLSMLLEKQYNFDMDIYDKFYALNKSYLGKKYDLITCTEVAEHFDNPIEYFRVFRNHIEDHGIISIMTSFIPKNKQDFLDWFYIRDRSHKAFYNLKTFEVIANIVGFEIVYSDKLRYITLKPKLS